MLESLIDAAKDAGPTGMLNVAGGALGLVLGVVTVVLTATSSPASRLSSVLALLCALLCLALGFAGHQLGEVATQNAFNDVPDDVKQLMLHHGAVAARLNFTIALGAATFPLLAALVTAALTRFRPALALAVVAAAAWAATLHQRAQPLPPETAPIFAPPGLSLPRSSSQQPLVAAALVALTPEGVWVEGQQVPTVMDALYDPSVRAWNSTTLTVLADGQVKFPALVQLLEAAELKVQLVVLGDGGRHFVIRIFRPNERRWPEKGNPPLRLTLRISRDAFTLGATGGTLTALPLDEKALNDKLAEIKASFPDNDTLRIGADDDVTVETLVTALDAARARDGKLLHGELVVGRFKLPKGDTSTIP